MNTAVATGEIESNSIFNVQTHEIKKQFTYFMKNSLLVYCSSVMNLTADLIIF